MLRKLFDDKIQRKVVLEVLKASLEIAIKYKKGPANFVRMNTQLYEKFLLKDIAGITVYEDVSVDDDTVVVGRLESSFIEEVKIKI